MYRTIPVKAKFTEEEKAFWIDQCQHANSLTNSAIYYVRQTHYARLEQAENAFTTYWRGDELRYGWKTSKCYTTYPELDKALKDNPHYKALAAQAAQQTLTGVAESVASHNGLVELYYQGEVDRPSLPSYRTKGGLAAVTFPSQLLRYVDGFVIPPISRETKPELITDIKLPLPNFIDFDWIKEVRVRPCLGELWIDWLIEDGKQPIDDNPSLDYSQAWGFDHGGTNWLTGVSTRGKSLIIDGRKLKSMNQGYSRLVAKYKEGKSDFYWDSNLDRIQRKRNNQMRDAINKAARFIINQCLHDKIGNLVIGWNSQQKNSSKMGKVGNQNFVPIPTGRLIERLKQLCPEYGIVLTITEEAYTSRVSFLDDDSLYKFGEKPNGWKPSGQRVTRGTYKSAKGFLINADCNGACNIIRKVATQLGVSLAEVGRGSLALPQRIDLFTRLSRSYRKSALRSVALAHVATSI
ncbi:RNA-guided endonuclease TnpB family protein [Aetokthonos hydrillicola Thurmond2011]|uniref:RNA-guided endonuclease TnpB family protein n=1 Tax=Aetokthonos hydrillicola Thurmond2011 TaxID=2712845 RepID=A0AAP5I1Y5_9CYAN|nr:RNA-guided endonuclease TnpB family protein [Aetokthonos hydrillicola]MBO3462877.1 IS200/IS605 family element transposase accessory protein TnpB [Aetokthonos hydrillicola CCALA 1050]MBW4589612.1 IS200/IS605 family accessory protein TnpB-related protein [Aetokthonos hydrillicola CCALA 1050]MDR9893215.1 RNA-guided endonuclease TnpB family protein [Aetokthonos hydrillicola Thurmond2011]